MRAAKHVRSIINLMIIITQFYLVVEDQKSLIDDTLEP